MHLSAGLNLPSIGLFGDTPLSYANYNKNIFPIIPENFKTQDHKSMAMNKITVEQVKIDLAKRFDRQLEKLMSLIQKA